MPTTCLLLAFFIVFAGLFTTAFSARITPISAQLLKGGEEQSRHAFGAAIDMSSPRSHFSRGNVTAQSQVQISNRSARMLNERIKSAREIQNANRQFAVKSLAPLNKHDQIHNGVTMMRVCSITLLLLGLSALLLLCSVHLLHGFRALCIPDASLVDHALLDLLVAAKSVVEQASRKDLGAWRHMMNKLRELRKDVVSKNHPLYIMVEAHMDEPGTKTQLQSLFLEASEGEELLTMDQLSLILANLHFEVTDLTKGGSQKFSLTHGDHAWLRNSIGQPITYSAFVSIFVLLLLVSLQAKIIILRGDGLALAENDLEVWKRKIEYYVEMRGHAVCRGSMLQGHFQKLNI